jgi:hypothetical protein
MDQYEDQKTVVMLPGMGVAGLGLVGLVVSEAYLLPVQVVPLGAAKCLVLWSQWNVVASILVELDDDILGPAGQDKHAPVLEGTGA